MSRPMISIVTPCFNEEGNVDGCVEEVRRTMTEELPGYDYEHIFCDNASTDKTVERLRELAEDDPRIRVIVNSRNVGPFRNIANGLRSVSGDMVVPMIPADLQDPPSVVPQMVRELADDVDVVYGIRGNRPENLLMRAARGIYYSAIRTTGGAAPPPHAGEFLLARREVIESINLVAGAYPYIRGLIAQTRPRYRTVHFDWAKRTVGKSRNSVPDLIDQALNGLVSTARTPIRAALFLGIILALAGVGIGIANFIIFVVNGTEAAQGIPTLIVSTFLFGGINLFFLGLIGEYILSIHSTVRPEPPMFERERINFEEKTR
ncbi:MAG: glycosyltransferase family 2 protein [Pseudolysinimonas sp.]